MCPVEWQEKPRQPLAPAVSKRRVSWRHHLTSSFPGEAPKRLDGAEEQQEEACVRYGLQRNILHLSNLVRVYQEELTRLRDQIKSKDVLLAELQNQSQSLFRQIPDDHDATVKRDGEATATAGGTPKLTQHGSMPVVDDQKAEGTTQDLHEFPQISNGEAIQDEMAAAVLGARQTEDTLLRANRDTRRQLERAIQEAELHRLDKQSATRRADLVEEEKKRLEVRIAHLTDELRLQAAPLMALQLDVKQARVDAEGMRERLQAERRGHRLSEENAEKIGTEAQRRIEKLEFDLGEAMRAAQREAQKATTYEKYYKEASDAQALLEKEVRQRRADAKRIAQELVLLQASEERSGARNGRSGAPFQTTPPTVDERHGKRGEGLLPPADTNKGNSEVLKLKEQVRKLEGRLTQSERARVDEVDASHVIRSRLEELEARESDIEAGPNRARDVEARFQQQAAAQAEALEAAESRARSLEEENGRLRGELEEQEDQHEALLERERELEHEIAAIARRHRQTQSLQGKLCRTVDELCEAEEAAELALTCLGCTRLLRDPLILVPCGHTLCAECCSDPSSGGVRGEGTGDRDGVPPREANSERMLVWCRLCEKEESCGGEKVAAAGSCEMHSAPNRAIATLTGKRAFRAQLLATLKQASLELWQYAVHAV